MLKQRISGIIILALCITSFFIYAYLVMLSEWSPIVLQLSMLMIAGGILGALSWIGYTMATTHVSRSFITRDENK